MSSALFVNEERKEQIRQWCERFRGRLRVPAEDVEVATRFGRTHALVAGPAKARPLVVLHGALTSSAHVMGQLGRLLESRRVYGIDVLGQSVWSEDRRVDVSGDDYGHWLLEACDGLGLGEVDVIGVSYGGYVALRAAILNPARIRRLMLLAPVGVVAADVWTGLRESGWPVLLYRLFPTRARLERVMRGIFTTLDEEWVGFFGEALRAYSMDMRVPPLLSDAELRRVTCRTLVLGSEFDASFPGKKLLARVKRFLPNAEVELLMGSKHCPPLTDEFREGMAQRVERFAR